MKNQLCQNVPSLKLKKNLQIETLHNWQLEGLVGFVVVRNVTVSVDVVDLRVHHLDVVVLRVHDLGVVVGGFITFWQHLPYRSWQHSGSLPEKLLGSIVRTLLCSLHMTKYQKQSSIT